MIYFDSAATSWPKPREVWEAMEHCIKFAGANPGRSGHQMALKAGRLVDEAPRNCWPRCLKSKPHSDVYLKCNGGFEPRLKGLFEKGGPCCNQLHGTQLSDTPAARFAGKRG